MLCGATLIDAGVNAPGSFVAGLRLIELCHGGLATATLGLVDLGGFVLPQVTVESLHPAFSTYRLQAAYPISAETPGSRICGPIRLWLDRSIQNDSVIPGVAVIELDQLPDDTTVLLIAERSGLPPQSLTLVVAPRMSVAGTTQITGRVNECIVFTMVESIHFDLSKVRQIVGQAPICPVGCAAQKQPYPDDFIHYAGKATLIVAAAPEDDLEALAHQLTFASLPIYGTFFHELLAQAGGVFENISGLVHVFKPAQVTINDLTTGRTARAGSSDLARLATLLNGGKGE
jgi:methenyltetrahydromethanopterin cyclohydrolase